ncbi:sodium/hydrogen exchanger 9B2-like [Hemiscyllium ocellatum]|uniref:sodium/hydrogen exchanger 9B2-like n=1 Tax=Hemiscyllium ocellatum TaxID=170820 RepID=UPI0029666F81|nr:sodium/hydrogen exchanger 9B2-like [Hemiscyllium ocellatum]XP_060707675.1 sodium/hydrogen exchanger 9B2-like [Hemiscyllium ocellatum]XP_060707676.1 sodium/hydrogen exchanger 9B2-like [Hemiscyllium ocellatum]
MANKNIEHLNNATNEERNQATLKIISESQAVMEKINSTDHSDAPVEVDETTLLNKISHNESPKSHHHGKLWRMFACPPQGIIASVLTKVIMVILLWAVVWSITGPECLPGGNLFGNLILFVCAVLGGKIVGMIKLPNLPPLPGLLGMLLAGFVLRNIPVVSDAIYIDYKWSSSLRSIALAIILTRAGLGLDAKALRKLKAVCLRLAFGPCLSEACVCAVLGHYLLHLPWSWSFILGFVMGAVSPAVVVPCMLMLQKECYGIDKGIPTLLMAAGSFDDILSITGFNTCLGIAFSSGSMVSNILRGFLEVLIGIAAGAAIGLFLRYFPSRDQEDLVMKRSYLLLGLAVFAIFATGVFGFPGSGGLCTIVMAFLAGVGWVDGKGGAEGITANAWAIFQPLLFGLIGAEISVSSLNSYTVGLGIATLSIALVVRIFVTFLMVHFSGFNIKERVFISLAWIPKATVQAAIGSVALDMARIRNDKTATEYGLSVLTVAFLGILITAPIGAVIIGLLGPKLLHKSNQQDSDHGEGLESKTMTSYEHHQGVENEIEV